ncbi:MAG: acyl carrier protein [Opitutaceae bacterium]|jgi:acyl carrier protein
MNTTRLTKCFQEALGIPAEQIVDGLAYNSIKQWDSVAHMALVAAIESEFNVMLNTDDIIGMSSVAVARQILAERHGVTFP